MNSKSTPQTTQSRKYRLRWLTLIVLSLSLTVITLDEMVINVALPTLQRELNASAAELQWMVNSYMIVFGGLLLMMGGLGDRFGRSKMLMGGLVLFALASLASAYTDSAMQLIGARALMGIGAAMIMPATLAIIVDVFEGEERTKAIAIWAALAGIGLALGPIIAGLLLRYFWWGSVFVINVPLAAIAIIAGLFFVPDSRDPETKPMDILGSVLSSGAVTALIYGIIEGPGKGWTSMNVIVAFTVMLLLGISFAVHEKRTSYPLLDFSFFKRPRFTTGAIGIGLMFLSVAGLMFGLTQYMQFVQGNSALEAGLKFLPLAGGMMVGAMGSEKLVKRFGAKKVIVAGMLLFAASLPLILLWEVDTAYWSICIAEVIGGFAIGLIMAPATEAVINSVPGGKTGVGSAVNDITRLVSGAIGIAVIGSAMYSFYSSKVTDIVSILPSEAAEAAKDSVGAAIQIASSLPGETGVQLSEIAKKAFVDGYGLAMLIGVGVSLFGALIIAKFMPTYDLESAEQPDLQSRSIEAGPLLEETTLEVVPIRTDK